MIILKLQERKKFTLQIGHNCLLLLNNVKDDHSNFDWLQSPLSGEGNGTPLQYSCLENPMGGGAWQAAVHGVAKSRTRLNDFTFTFHFSLSCIGEGNGNPLQCSCLENPRYGGAWWAAVYGVAQSQTRLKRHSSSSLRYCIFIQHGVIQFSGIIHGIIQFSLLNYTG